MNGDFRTWHGWTENHMMAGPIPQQRPRCYFRINNVLSYCLVLYILHLIVATNTHQYYVQCAKLLFGTERFIRLSAETVKGIS